MKGDRGRIPSGCTATSGSCLSGPLRKANQGGKEGEFVVYRSTIQFLTVRTDMGADLVHVVPVAAIQSTPHRPFA
jgi:hypothetical protein